MNHTSSTLPPSTPLLLFDANTGETLDTIPSLNVVAPNTGDPQEVSLEAPNVQETPNVTLGDRMLQIGDYMFDSPQPNLLGSMPYPSPEFIGDIFSEIGYGVKDLIIDPLLSRTPLGDLEDLRLESQTGKAVYGVVGGAAHVLGDTVGALFGLGQDLLESSGLMDATPEEQANWDKFYGNNAVVDYMESLDETASDLITNPELATMSPEQKQNEPWYVQATRPDFWTEEAAQGLGSFIGFILPGFGTEALLAKTLVMYRNLPWAARALGKFVSSIAGAEVMTALEGSAEGIQTFKEVKERNLETYKEQLTKEGKLTPEEVEFQANERALKDASNAASYVFRANHIVLGSSNAAELILLGLPYGKLGAQIAKVGAGYILEGGQESLQWGIQERAKEIFQPNMEDPTKWTSFELFREKGYGATTLKGLLEGDPEVWKSQVIGGMLGGGAQAVGSYNQYKEYSGLKENLKDVVGPGSLITSLNQIFEYENVDAGDGTMKQQLKLVDGKPVINRDKLEEHYATLEELGKQLNDASIATDEDVTNMLHNQVLGTVIFSELENGASEENINKVVDELLKKGDKTVPVTDRTGASISREEFVAQRKRDVRDAIAAWKNAHNTAQFFNFSSQEKKLLFDLSLQTAQALKTKKTLEESKEALAKNEEGSVINAVQERMLNERIKKYDEIIKKLEATYSEINNSEYVEYNKSTKAREKRVKKLTEEIRNIVKSKELLTDEDKKKIKELIESEVKTVEEEIQKIKLEKRKEKLTQELKEFKKTFNTLLDEIDNGNFKKKIQLDIENKEKVRKLIDEFLEKSENPPTKEELKEFVDKEIKPLYSHEEVEDFAIEYYTQKSQKTFTQRVKQKIKEAVEQARKQREENRLAAEERKRRKDEENARIAGDIRGKSEEKEKIANQDKEKILNAIRVGIKPLKFTKEEVEQIIKKVEEELKKGKYITNFSFNDVVITISKKDGIADEEEYIRITETNSSDKEFSRRSVKLDFNGAIQFMFSDYTLTEENIRKHGIGNLTEEDLQAIETELSNRFGIGIEEYELEVEERNSSDRNSRIVEITLKNIPEELRTKQSNGEEVIITGFYLFSDDKGKRTRKLEVINAEKKTTMIPFAGGEARTDIIEDASPTPLAEALSTEEPITSEQAAAAENVDAAEKEIAVEGLVPIVWDNNLETQILSMISGINNQQADDFWSGSTKMDENVAYRNIDGKDFKYVDNLSPEELLPGTKIELIAVDKAEDIIPGFYDIYRTDDEIYGHYPVKVVATLKNGEKRIIGYLHTESKLAEVLDTAEDTTIQQLNRLKFIRQQLLTTSNNKIVSTNQPLFTTIKDKGPGKIVTNEAKDREGKFVFEPLSKLPKDAYELATVSDSGTTIVLANSKELDSTLGEDYFIDTVLLKNLSTPNTTYLVALVRASNKIVSGREIPVWYAVPLRPITFETLEQKNSELYNSLNNTLKGSFNLLTDIALGTREAENTTSALNFLKLFLPSVGLNFSEIKAAEGIEEKDMKLDTIATYLRAKVKEGSEDYLFMEYIPTNETFYFFRKSADIGKLPVVAISLKKIRDAVEKNDIAKQQRYTQLIGLVTRELELTGGMRLHKKMIEEQASTTFQIRDSFGTDQRQTLTLNEILSALFTTPLRSFEFTDSDGNKVNRVVIQPRIQIDLSKFEQETKKEEKIESRIDLEQRLQTGISLNDDGTKYVDAESNEEYVRTSNFINDNASVFGVEPFPAGSAGVSRERGTAIDTVIREYLENPESFQSSAEIAGRLNTVFRAELAKSNNTSALTFSSGFATQLQQLLNNFKQTLDVKGLIYTTKEFSFGGTIQNVKVAGTTDILAYDPISGTWYIIDIKTSARDRYGSGELYQAKDEAQQNIYRKLLADHLGIDQSKIKLQILPLQISQSGKYFNSISLSTAPSNTIQGTMDISTDRTVDDFFSPAIPEQEEIVDEEATELEEGTSPNPEEVISSNIVVEDTEQQTNAEEKNTEKIRELYELLKTVLNVEKYSEVHKTLKEFSTIAEFFSDIDEHLDEAQKTQIYQLAIDLSDFSMADILEFGELSTLEALNPLTHAMKEDIKDEIEHNPFIINGLSSSQLSDLMFDAFAFVTDKMMSKPHIDNTEKVKTFKEAFELYVKELQALLPQIKKETDPRRVAALLRQQHKKRLSIKALDAKIEKIKEEKEKEKNDKLNSFYDNLIKDFETKKATTIAELNEISAKLGQDVVVNPKLLIVLKTRNIKKLERLLEQMFKQQRAAIKSAENTDLEGTEQITDEDDNLPLTETEEAVQADELPAEVAEGERIFGQDVGVDDPMSSIPALLRAKLSNIDDKAKSTYTTNEEGETEIVPGELKRNFLGRVRKVPYQEAFYAIKAILKDTPNDIDAIIESLKENEDAYPWLDQVIRELETAKESNKKYVQQFTTKMPSHAMTMLGVMTKINSSNDGTTSFRSFVYNSNSNEASRTLILNWNTNADFTEVFQTMDGVVVFNSENALKVVKKIDEWQKTMATTNIPVDENTFRAKRTLPSSNFFNPNNISTTKTIKDETSWDEIEKAFIQSDFENNGKAVKRDNVTGEMEAKLSAGSTVTIMVSANRKEGKKEVSRNFNVKISKNSNGTYRVEMSQFSSAKLVAASEIISTLGMLGIELSLKTVERLQDKPIIIRGKTKYFSDLFTEDSGVFNVLRKILKDSAEAARFQTKPVTTEKDNLFESTVAKTFANFEVFYGGLLGTPSNFRESKKQLHTYTKRKMVTDKIMHILYDIKNRKGNDPESTVFSILNSIFNSDSGYLKLLTENSDLAEEFKTQLASPAHASLNVLKQQARDYVMTKKLKDLPRIEQEFVQMVFFLESSNENVTNLELENLVGTSSYTVKKSVNRYFVPKMSDKDTEIILSGIRYSFDEGTTEQKNDFNLSNTTQKATEAIYIDRVILPELKRIIHSVRNKTNYKAKEYGRGSKLFMNTPILDSIVLDANDKEGPPTTLKKYILDYAAQMSSLKKPDGTAYTVEEIAKNILQNVSLKKFNQNVFRYAAFETIKAEATSRLSLWDEGNLIQKNDTGQVKGLLHLESSKFQSILSGQSGEAKVRYLAYIMSFNILVDAAEQQMLVLGDPAHKSKVSKEEFVKIIEAFESGTVESKTVSETVGNRTDHKTIFTVKNRAGEIVLEGDSQTLAEKWTEISKHSYINTGKRLANLIAPGERGVEKGHLYYFPIKDIEAESYVLDSVLATLNDKSIEEIGRMNPEQKSNLIGGKQYSKINTADGQEWGTWQEGLHFRYTKGDLSFAQMNALKRAIETKKHFDDFTKEEKELTRILLLGKAQQPDKLVYTGHNYEGVENQDDKGVSRELYVKSSTVYLLPQLTAGREIDKVRIFMEKVQAKLIDETQLGNGLVRFPFESAVKLGLKAKPFEILNSNGEYVGQEIENTLDNENTFKDFVSTYGIKAARKNLREQLSVSNKSVKPFASKSIRGSQSAKLLWIDVLNGDNGKPINGFNFRGRTVKGMELYNTYMTTYGEIYTLKRQQLFEELGLNSSVNEAAFKLFVEDLAEKLVSKENQNVDTATKKTLIDKKIVELFDKNPKELELMLLREGFNPFITHGMRKGLAKDISKLITSLKKEARDRGYDIAAQDGLQFRKNNENGKTSADLNLPLWLNSSSDTFEALLNAIVSNRVHKIMFPGYSYVLAADTLSRKKKPITDTAGFIEKHKDQIIWTKPEYAEQTNLHGHHVDSKGVVHPDQVIVQSKFMDNDGNVINLHEELEKLRASGNTNAVGKWIKLVDGVPTLNKDNFDEKLLKIFGMRIPTSGLMSMATIEIVGFAPPTVGDIVVAPRDLVVRMGSDFDIDKLYSYMKGHIINSEGKLQTLDEEKLEDYLSQFIPEGLSREETEQKRIKLIKKFTEKFLLDKIVDIHFSVLENPHKTIQKNILTPLDTEKASESADYIRNLTAKKPNKQFQIGDVSFEVTKKGFSPLSSLFQIEERVAANSFKTGISVKSLNSTLHATIQQADAVANSQSSNSTVNRTVNLERIVETDAGLRRERIHISLFGIDSDGSFGRSETLVQSPDEKAHLISFVNAEEQQTMLDGKKLDIAGAVNDTQITFPFRRALTLLGFYGLTTTNEKNNPVFVRVGDILCMQPVIVEFIKRLEEVQGQLKEYTEDAFNTIAADLFVELEEKNTNDTQIDLQELSSLDKAKRMISLNFEDIQDSEEAELQTQVLKNFLLLTAVGNKLGTVQTLINSDSKRADKSIFVNIEKIRTILNISKETFSTTVANEKITMSLTGLEGLLGDFKVIEHSDLAKEMQERGADEPEIDILDLAHQKANSSTRSRKIEGAYHYLESVQSGDKLFHVFLRPTTVNGLATVHVLGTASNIYESLFPYQSEQFEKAYARLAKITGIDKKSVNQRANFRRLLFQEFKKHIVSNSKVQRLTPNSAGAAALFLPYTFDSTGSAGNGFDLKNHKELSRFTFQVEVNGQKIRAVDLIHLYLKGYTVNGFATPGLNDTREIVNLQGDEKDSEKQLIEILKGKLKTVTLPSKNAGNVGDKLILTASDSYATGVEVEIVSKQDVDENSVTVTIKDPKIQPLHTDKDLKNFRMTETDYQILGFKKDATGILVADNDVDLLGLEVSVNNKNVTLGRLYRTFKAALFGISQDATDTTVKAIATSGMNFRSDSIINAVGNALQSAKNSDGTTNIEAGKVHKNLMEKSKVVLNGRTFTIFSQSMSEPVKLFVKLTLAGHLTNKEIKNFQDYDTTKGTIEEFLKGNKNTAEAQRAVESLITAVFKDATSLKEDTLLAEKNFVRSPSVNRKSSYQLVQKATPRAAASLGMAMSKKISFLNKLENDKTITLPMNEVIFDNSGLSEDTLKAATVVFTENLDSNPFFNFSKSLNIPNSGGYITFEGKNGKIFKAEIITDNNGANLNVKFSEFNLEEEYQRILESWISSSDNLAKLSELKDKLEIGGQVKKKRLYDSKKPPYDSVNGNTHERGLVKLLNFSFASQENTVFSDFPDQVDQTNLKSSAFAVLEFSGAVDNKKSNDKYFFLRSAKVAEAIKQGILVKDDTKTRGQRYKDSIMIHGDYYTVRDAQTEQGTPMTVIVVDNASAIIDQYNSYITSANKNSVRGLSYHESLKDYQFEVSGIDELKQMMFFDESSITGIPIFNDQVMNTTGSQVVVLIKGTDKYNEIMGNTVLPGTEEILYNFPCGDGLIRNVYVIDNNDLSTNPSKVFEKLKEQTTYSPDIQFKFALYSVPGINPLEVQRQLVKTVLPKNVYFPLSMVKKTFHVTEEFVETAKVKFIETRIEREDKEERTSHDIIFEDFIRQDIDKLIWFSTSSEAKASSAFENMTSKVTINKDNHLPSPSTAKNLEELKTKWRVLGSNLANLPQLKGSGLKLGIDSDSIFDLKDAISSSSAVGFEFEVVGSDGKHIKMSLQTFLDKHALPEFFKGILTVNPKLIASISTAGNTGIEEAAIKAIAALKSSVPTLRETELNVFAEAGYGIIKEGKGRTKQFPLQSGFKRRYGVVAEMKRISFPRFFKDIVSNIEDIAVLQDYSLLNDKKRWSFDLHEGKQENAIYWNNTLQTGENSNFYASFARMLADNRTIQRTIRNENGEEIRKEPVIWNNGSEVPEVLTVSRLAQYMIAYENLRSGGVQKAKEFAKFIPPFYYQLLGATASINSLDLSDPTILGREENETTSFERTFIQSHPKYAKRIREKEDFTFKDHFLGLNNLKHLNQAPQIVKLSQKGAEALGGKIKRFPKFISIYDAQSKDYIIFELADTTDLIIYQRIDSYFKKKVSMYNSDLSKNVAEVSNVNRVEKSLASYGLIESQNSSVLDILSKLKALSDNPYFKTYATYLQERIQKIQQNNVPIGIEFVPDIDNGKTIARIEFNTNNLLQDGFVLRISNNFLVSSDKINDFEEIESVILHELGHIDDVMSLTNYIYLSGGQTTLKLLPDQPSEKEKEIHKVLTKLQELYNAIHLITTKQNKNNFENALATAYGQRLATYKGKNLYEFITEVRTDKELQKAMNDIAYNSTSTFLDAFKVLIKRALDLIRGALGIEVKPNSMLYEAIALIEELKYATNKDKSSGIKQLKVAADGTQYEVTITGNTLVVKNLDNGSEVQGDQETLRQFVEGLNDNAVPQNAQKNTTITEVSLEQILNIRTDNDTVVLYYGNGDLEEFLKGLDDGDINEHTYILTDQKKMYHIEGNEKSGFTAEEVTALTNAEKVLVVSLMTDEEGGSIPVAEEYKDVIRKMTESSKTTLTRITVSGFIRANPQIAETLRTLLNNNTIKRKNCN